MCLFYPDVNGLHLVRYLKAGLKLNIIEMQRVVPRHISQERQAIYPLHMLVTRASYFSIGSFVTSGQLVGVFGVDITL